MIPISDAPGVRRTFPYVTIALIAVNVLVFLYEASLSELQLGRLFLAAGAIPTELLSGRDVPPLAPGGLVYTTLVTSMFLHGGWLHLVSNMLYLWVFGDNVEDATEHVPFVAFYFLCGFVASLTHIAFNVGSEIPSVGASGAIAGVLGAYLVLYPRAQVRTILFLGPFISFPRISAIIVIGLWFVLQLLGGIASLGAEASGSGVAVWAHVGGFVAGFVLVQLFRRRAPAY